MSEELVEYQAEENVDVVNIEQWKIDSMIQEVKDNNEEIEKFETILNDRIKNLQHQFNTKKESLTKRNHFLLSTLGEYAKTQKLSKAKTQSTYKSLVGNVVIKHAAQSVAKPAKDSVSKIKELYPEFVEEVVENKVNWKDLKKKFIIQDGVIYDQESGENVGEVFGIETKDEEIIVK